MHVNARTMTRSIPALLVLMTMAARAWVLAAHDDSVQIPFEEYHRLPFLTVRVNDTATMSFVLDTGASLTVIDEKRARDLRLALQDTQRIAGRDGGEGAITFSLAKGVTIDVGATQFRPDHTGVTSFAKAENLMGHPMDGVLGGDFISRYVVEVDYSKHVVTLHDSKTYRPPASGETLPLKIVDGYPCVSARVQVAGREPFDVLFGIDTGDGGTGIGLNSPFVKRHRLLEALETIPGFSAGLSGESGVRTGRAERLMLGRTTILKPIVGVSVATAGAHARSEIDGLLGSEIWRRFRVVLDYSRRRITLEPNEHVDDPFETDMSGLRFEATGDRLTTFTVMRVRPQSPAADAGLLAGDILIALDDRPAATLTLMQVEQLLAQDGRERQLTIARGDRTLTVRLRLKRAV